MSTDTYELRSSFAHEFMWMTTIDPSETTMRDMLDVFHDDLCEAPVKYAMGIDVDGPWNDALEWLSDRGYSMY